MTVFVDSGNSDSFERFVESHPKGHFLQSLKWASVKSPQPHAAVMSVDENGNIRGAMSMFVYPERLFGLSLLYAPRGPVCAADDTAAMRDLFNGAEQIARKHRAVKLVLDPDITEEDNEFLKNLGVFGVKRGDNRKDNTILQPFSVFRIDIKNKTHDELMEMFHSKARYDVRSALKKGAVCEIGARDDLPAFHSLLRETAERDGFTVRSPGYFEKMYDVLAPDNLKLFVVKHEGVVIAGSVLIRYGNKSWHMYAGSGEAYKDLLPNYLMQWEMMRWSAENGVDIYDMRGIAGERDKTKPLDGLFRFKKRFGGELFSFVGRLELVYNPAAVKAISALKAIKRLPGRILKHD